MKRQRIPVALSVSIKLGPDILQEADELVPVLRQDAKLRASGRVSRSSVLRLALLEGMAVLRKTYGKTNRGKAAK